MESPRPPPPEFGPFQFVILVLSVFVLGILALELLPATWLPVNDEVRRLLHWIDFVICLVFLSDFIVRFREAPSKLRFMKWGWVDLLASIPTVDFLRWGRVLRLLRLVRLLRAMRTLRNFLRVIYASRAQGGVASVLVIVFLVMSLSSVAVLLFETAPRSNIRTAGDAVWWCMTTITTVGYGDLYPVTTGGRMIAALLMLTGVGMFGTFSGIVATFLLGDGKNEGRQAPVGDPEPERESRPRVSQVDS
jgi:voltage-gated potassium channel